MVFYLILQACLSGNIILKDIVSVVSNLVPKIKIDGSAKITENEIDLNASLTFLHPRVLTSTGRILFNWDQGELLLKGGATIGDGFITTGAEVKLDTSPHLSFSLGGTAAVNIPNFVWLVGGQPITSGNIKVEVSDDDNATNDYGMVWTEYLRRVPDSWNDVFSPSQWTTERVKKGFKLAFNTFELTRLGDDEIEPTNSWTIPTGLDEFTMTLDVEHFADDFSVRIKQPDGSYVNEEDFADGTNSIVLVDALSSQTRKTVTVFRPEAGVWDIEAMSSSDLGVITSHASQPAFPAVQPCTRATGSCR